MEIHPFKGSSPLSRGIHPRIRKNFTNARIIPALAGNTSASNDRSSGPSDHPRSRGEYCGAHGVSEGSKGSSPLSRGIRKDINPPGASLGIIPALAGNTQTSDSYGRSGSDHPRSRGEYPYGTPCLHILGGSSPLSRGILSAFKA